MAKTLSVKGTRDAADIDGQKGNPVILWEKHPDHPDGEVFIADDGNTYSVGETAAVKELLHEGRLVKAGGEGKAEQPSQAASAANGQPFAGYDALSADDVIARLGSLDDAGRARGLTYERGKGARGRKSIIDALVNWNSRAGA